MKLFHRTAWWYIFYFIAHRLTERGLNWANNNIINNAPTRSVRSDLRPLTTPYDPVRPLPTLADPEQIIIVLFFMKWALTFNVAQYIFYGRYKAPIVLLRPLQLLKYNNRWQTFHIRYNRVCIVYFLFKENFGRF